MCHWCRHTFRTSEYMHTLRRWRRRHLSAVGDGATVVAVTYCDDATVDSTWDSSVPTSVSSHLLIIAPDFIGIDALFCAVCYYSLVGTVSLAVLFFTDADIKCSLLLCHVYNMYSCIWHGRCEICLTQLHRMDAVCCVCTKPVQLVVVQKLEVIPKSCLWLFYLQPLENHGNIFEKLL